MNGIGITEEFIEKYINDDRIKGTIGYELFQTSNISIEFAEKYKKENELYWKFNHRTDGCSWEYAAMSPNFTVGWIKKIIDKYGVSNNDDDENLNEYSHLTWDSDAYESVSSNPAITLKDIEDNLDMDWNWEYIASNPNIRMYFVKKYKDKFKHAWDRISQNPGITTKDIEDNLELDWNWYHVSKNVNIDINFVKKYKDQLEAFVIANPGITMNDIRDNPDVDWDYDDISINPNITFEFIEDNLEKIDWFILSGNKFTYERQMACKLKYQDSLPDDIINIILKYMVCIPCDEWYEI
jgi:hypothetical protein